MDITEIRVKLMENRRDKLQAFCSITIQDEFVIRDLKIIDGTSGPFVAMPSRKLTGRCPKCGSKNHLRANHCNDCGAKLSGSRAAKDNNGKTKYHADVAHPINSTCREFIQEQVLKAFTEEVEKSKNDDYVPTDYDEYDDDASTAAATDEPRRSVEAAPARPAPRKPKAPRTLDGDFEVIHDGDTDEFKPEPAAEEPPAPPAEPEPVPEPVAPVTQDTWAGGFFDDEPAPAVAQPKPMVQQPQAPAEPSLPEPEPEPATRAAEPVEPAPEPKQESSASDGFSNGIL